MRHYQFILETPLAATLTMSGEQLGRGPPTGREMPACCLAIARFAEHSKMRMSHFFSAALCYCAISI